MENYEVIDGHKTRRKIAYFSVSILNCFYAPAIFNAGGGGILYHLCPYVCPSRPICM